MALAEIEKDDTLAAEVQEEVEQAARHIEEMEFELAFSGQYDSRNAILSIHAGAGGTESQDWPICCSECILVGLKEKAIKQKFWTFPWERRQV